MATWPDTSALQQPEHDTAWARAAWLLGRHPQLSALLERTGLAIEDPSDPGRPDLELDALAEAFFERQRVQDAWKQYEATKPSYPREDEGEHAFEQRCDRWVEAGPKCETSEAEALGLMSSTEVARLRLLAALAPTVRVPFHLGDLWGLDDAGSRLVADWCRLVARA